MWSKRQYEEGSGRRRVALDAPGSRQLMDKTPSVHKTPRVHKVWGTSREHQHNKPLPVMTTWPDAHGTLLAPRAIDRQAVATR